MNAQPDPAGNLTAPRALHARPVASVDGGDKSRLDVLIRNFAHTLQSEVAMVCQLRRKADLEVIYSWGTGADPERIGGAANGHAGGFVGRALSRGRPVFERLDPESDASLIRATDGAPLTHAAATPVRIPGGRRSGLIAGFTAPPEDLPSTLSAAASYSELITLCLKHPSMLDGLLESSREDGLTGCLTYDSSVRELTREINRSARAGLRLSCCFIDLDGFKRVNDQHGHIHGNRVLAEVAQILRAGVRSCDTVGRYGGDEFIAILPQTTEDEANQLAERLRTLIGAAPISTIQEPVSASIGVAEWTPQTTAEELLLVADNALLAAKAARGTPPLIDR